VIFVIRDRITGQFVCHTIDGFGMTRDLPFALQIEATSARDFAYGMSALREKWNLAQGDLVPVPLKLARQKMQRLS
jgi:hypothetical protein